MNFYKHHIGDYAAATAHLSILEDGVYSRLLRIYYRDEKPLPAERKAIYRLVMARSRDEREAVDTILDEFFIADAEGWRNKRADEELARAGAQAETNRRIAEDREAKRRARNGNEQTTNRSETKNDSSNESLNETSTCSREPSHKPLARLQTPDSRSNSTHADFPGEPPPPTPMATDAGRACRAMRDAGCPPNQLNPSHPDLVAAIREGITSTNLADTVREGIARSPPVAKVFTWAIATARGRLEESRNRTPHPGAAPHAARSEPRRVGLADR